MLTGMFLSVLGLGFLLGLKHALDPDHLVAVSTIIGESASLKRSSLVGTFWGLGHTTSLILVGTAVIALKLQISDRLALWMELAVALMLVVLGVKAILKPLLDWKLHIHAHRHDGRAHAHLHFHRLGEEHTHEHRHLISLGSRPFLVGMVHGMAGSAPLTILVLATIPSAFAGVIYIGIFGIGSIGGMLIVSALISVPFLLTRKHFIMFNGALLLTVGLMSIAFGIFLIWKYGFHEHLLY